jgi:hypothetical protein
VTTVADLHLLDHEIRALLVRDLTDQYVDDAMAVARVRLAAELEAATPARPARRRIAMPRLQPLRAALVVGAVVLAIAAATALRSTDHRARAPRLAASASAAQTLRFASAALDDSALSGTGSTLHATQVEHAGTRVIDVHERWFDRSSGQWRDVESKLVPGLELVRLSDFDGRVERVRAFQRLDGADWTMSANSLAQLDVVGGVAPAAPMLGGPVFQRHPAPGAGTGPYRGAPYRVSVNLTREAALGRWLHEVADASDEPAVLEATARFMASTRGYFIEGGGDRTPEAIHATSIRQLLYLVESAPVSDDALRVLYGRLASFEGMRRLDDVTVDGRPAARIQFDALSTHAFDAAAVPDERDLAALLLDARLHSLSVLVIDQASGRVVRLESVDRRVWSSLERPTLADGVGDDPATCGDASPFEVPCSLLLGDHPVARRADARARQPVPRDVAFSLAVDASVLADDNRVVSGPASSVDQFGRPVPTRPWSPVLPPGAL